jgi:hypothetical protein
MADPEGNEFDVLRTLAPQQNQPASPDATAVPRRPQLPSPQPPDDPSDCRSIRRPSTLNRTAYPISTQLHDLVTCENVMRPRGAKSVGGPVARADILSAC